MLDTVVFIILYGKGYSQSSTLISVLDIIDSDASTLDNYTFVIINNGPLQLDSKGFYKIINREYIEKYMSVFYFEEFVFNMPLSKLYNKMFDKYSHFSRYIILDDDTPINKEYFLNIDNTRHNVDIKIPTIMSNYDYEIYYPLLNDKVDSKIDPHIYSDEDKVSTIGSGMVIYKSLLDKFKLKNLKVFDERFALYGVDVSIFKRISLLKNDGLTFTIMKSSILKHDLSRVSEDYSYFRHRERLIDSTLSTLLYPESFYSTFKYLSKNACKLLSERNFRLFFLLLKLIFKRKHPRC